MNKNILRKSGKLMVSSCLSGAMVLSSIACAGAKGSKSSDVSAWFKRNGKYVGYAVVGTAVAVGGGVLLYKLMAPAEEGGNTDNSGDNTLTPGTEQNVPTWEINNAIIKEAQEKNKKVKDEAFMKLLNEARPEDIVDCIYPKVVGNRTHASYAEYWSDIRNNMWNVLKLAYHIGGTSADPDVRAAYGSLQKLHAEGISTPFISKKFISESEIRPTVEFIQRYKGVLPVLFSDGMVSALVSDGEVKKALANFMSDTALYGGWTASWNRSSTPVIEKNVKEFFRNAFIILDAQYGIQAENPSEAVADGAEE